MFYPRFNLRLLLLAVTAFAVLLATWTQSVRKQRRGVAWVLAQGGHVTYDFEWPEADGSYPLGAKPPGPKCLHDWLGVDFFPTATGVILDRDEITDLAPLRHLRNLRFIGLMNFVHPETDFSPLRELPQLEELHLSYTGIDVEFARSLRAMLPGCRITSQTNPELEN